MSDLHLCRVVRFHQLGGPEVLRLENEEPLSPNRMRFSCGPRRSP
ncbi:hypothetical protein [Paracoccus sp. SM22M-07]|nr:hypothetical protein [Paracoccus sp. SM22M-07]